MDTNQQAKLNILNFCGELIESLHSLPVRVLFESRLAYNYYLINQDPLCKDLFKRSEDTIQLIRDANHRIVSLVEQAKLLIRSSYRNHAGYLADTALNSMPLDQSAAGSILSYGDLGGILCLLKERRKAKLLCNGLIDLANRENKNFLQAIALSQASRIYAYKHEYDSIDYLSRYIRKSHLPAFYIQLLSTFSMGSAFDFDTSEFAKWIRSKPADFPFSDKREFDLQLATMLKASGSRDDAIDIVRNMVVSQSWGVSCEELIAHIRVLLLSGVDGFINDSLHVIQIIERKMNAGVERLSRLHSIWVMRFLCAVGVFDLFVKVLEGEKAARGASTMWNVGIEEAFECRKHEFLKRALCFFESEPYYLEARINSYLLACEKLNDIRCVVR